MVSSGSSPERRESQVYDKADVERINTLERAGTNAEYYEKGGLRTEGDGVDHDGTHHKVSNARYRVQARDKSLTLCSSLSNCSVH